MDVCYYLYLSVDYVAVCHQLTVGEKHLVCITHLILMTGMMNQNVTCLLAKYPRCIVRTSLCDKVLFYIFRSCCVHQFSMFHRFHACHSHLITQ